MKTDQLLLFGILAAGAIYLAAKPKDESTEPTIDPTQTVSEPRPMAPIPLNKDLMLKVGSKGQEVSALQIALGFKGNQIDGDFGNKTLTALQNRKGVAQVTLNQFNVLPNVTGTMIQVGDAVESNTFAAFGYANKIDKGVNWKTNSVVNSFFFNLGIGTVVGISNDRKNILVQTNQKQLLWFNAGDIKKV